MKYNTLLLCMFLCARVFSQNVNVADYYFYPDNQYKTYQWGSGSGEETERVIIGNGNCVSEGKNTLPNGTEIPFRTQMKFNTNEVKEISFYNVVNQRQEPFNKVILMMPNNEWRFQHSFEELYLMTSFRSKVTTAHGIYEDCIAVKEQFSSSNEELQAAFGNIYYIYYYARNRGLVAKHAFDSNTHERVKGERVILEKEFVDRDFQSYSAANNQEAQKVAKSKAIKIKEQEEKAKLIAQEAAKIYNLEEYDKALYQDVVDELREAITKHFQTASTERDKTNFPDFRSLRRENDKHVRYTSTYDLHYKLHPENKPVNELGYTSQYRQDGFQTLLKKKNVTGDTNYPLYDKARMRIPHVVKSGAKAKTEVYLNNVQVDFARGITEVKVKKKKVKFKQNLPYIDLQPTLASKMMAEQKGKYLVEYEISNIMGKETVSTELTKKKGKTFKKVAIGSAVVVGAAFYFAGDFILESLGF